MRGRRSAASRCETFPVSSDADHGSNRWKWGAAGILLIALALIWRPGCRDYPTVTSPESLQLIKLVYAACNSKSLERLEKAEATLAELAQQNKVTPREKSAFESIFAMAHAGKWEQAEQASYRFAEDQIGRGHSGTASSGNHAHDDLPGHQH
jgi:hypothetical protein